MTHRQAVIWNLFLDEYLNHPGRTDHYLMQLTDEVRHGNGDRRLGPAGLRVRFDHRRRAGGVPDELRCEYTAAEMAAMISRQKAVKAVEATGGKPVRTAAELPEAYQRHVRAGLEMKRRRDEARAKGEAFTWPRNKRSGE
jgi:hypothetical protein